jgi:Fe-Mn family superoxide dismutase
MNKEPKLSLDLKAIVKECIKESNIRELIEPPLVATSIKDLDEAVVAQPKTYQQYSSAITPTANTAHNDLYKKYVEMFNDVSARLDTAKKLESNSSHAEFRSLKLDEAYNTNAVWLHELFFANCFDPHSEIYMDSLAYMRLERDFGSFDAFQRDFIGCGLSAGNGWIITGLNVFMKKYVTTFISNHSGDVMLGLIPILVVDMNEHAYNHDFLNDKKSYIVAMMKEIRWPVVEERVTKVDKILEVLK